MVAHPERDPGPTPPPPLPPSPITPLSDKKIRPEGARRLDTTDRLTVVDHCKPHQPQATRVIFKCYIVQREITKVSVTSNALKNDLQRKEDINVFHVVRIANKTSSNHAGGRMRTKLKARPEVGTNFQPRGASEKCAGRLI